jgi:MFS family permease
MTAQDDQNKSAQLVTRLERLPFSGWHRNFFIVAFCGIAFDAVDFALFGAALPPVAREFGLGPAQSGLLATVGLIGAFLGGFSGARCPTISGAERRFRRRLACLRFLPASSRRRRMSSPLVFSDFSRISVSAARCRSP